jgi:Flp pilus assembly protein TadB
MRVPGSPRTPPAVFVLTAAVAVGSCAIVAAVVLGSWPVIAGGAVVMGAALVRLWVIQRRRDRTLW